SLTQRARGKGGSASVFKASAERFPHPKGEGERRTGIGIQGLRRTVPSPKGRGGKADRHRYSRLVPNGSLTQRARGKGGPASVFKACAERFPLPKGEGERRIGIGIQG
ncbi:hypothetical protein SR82_24545, partial [Klebsiella aerogenes]